MVVQIHGPHGAVDAARLYGDARLRRYPRRCAEDRLPDPGHHDRGERARDGRGNARLAAADSRFRARRIAGQFLSRRRDACRRERPGHARLHRPPRLRRTCPAVLAARANVIIIDMRWSEQGPGQRRGYHHGNLRETLIEAALDLIARKGPAGFTFAEAARWAGVSSAAPYRHFRDRDALIADVALLGFDRDEPAYYSAMFEAGVPLDGNPELREAGEAAFAVLRRAAETFCARLPAEKRPPALMMSLHIWALSHGIASLFARGDAGRRSLPMTPEELLEAGVLVYLRGLGIIEGENTG